MSVTVPRRGRLLAGIASWEIYGNYLIAQVEKASTVKGNNPMHHAPSLYVQSSEGPHQAGFSEYIYRGLRRYPDK